VVGGVTRFFFQLPASAVSLLPLLFLFPSNLLSYPFQEDRQHTYARAHTHTLAQHTGKMSEQVIPIPPVQQRRTSVGGCTTDFVITHYSDRIFVLVTQTGKLSTLVCSPRFLAVYCVRTTWFRPCVRSLSPCTRCSPLRCSSTFSLCYVCIQLPSITCASPNLASRDSRSNRHREPREL
jgi:hypothetical protein